MISPFFKNNEIFKNLKNFIDPSFDYFDYESVRVEITSSGCFLATFYKAKLKFKIFPLGKRFYIQLLSPTRFDGIQRKTIRGVIGVDREEITFEDYMFLKGKRKKIANMSCGLHNSFPRIKLTYLKQLFKDLNINYE